MIDKSALPHPVPIQQVTINDGFWAQRQTTNRTRTIPAIYHQLEATGRLHAWSLDPNREPPPYHKVVHMFWDSDTGKWVEAAGYSLHTHPDEALQKQVDNLISKMESAQQPDGYLNTYFTVLEPENRWRNLRDWHELYNAGHLIEGAVAYYKATGKRTLLDVLCRYTDLIDSRYGPDEGKERGYPGHPELELALVKLYRETGEGRYLKLSKYFIDERGQQPHFFDMEAERRGDNPADFWAETYHYCQAHEPVREQTEATGHAVRACYLYAGMADVALETGDEELLAVSKRLWDDLTQHQMYVTGGLGPANFNEGFTFAYDLPNESAYAETCAAIALAFWAQRMFSIDPNGRYIDVMERAIYNGSLSGVSFDGTQFFYANPLAAYPGVNPYSPSAGVREKKHYRREDWFYCPCCPPNAARLIASIGEYFYAQTDNRVYAQLYGNNTAKLTLGGQQEIALQQQTNYPWDGEITFTLYTAEAVKFDLALRIPGWCYSYGVSVNGEAQSIIPVDGYILLSRTWQDGDTVELTLNMPVERVMPHPNIRQNAGHIALQRGPLVYCLEGVDNGKQLQTIVIPQDTKFEVTFDQHLFDGTAVITGQAYRQDPDRWGDDPYVPQSRKTPEHQTFTFKAIPYFLWANREPGEMRVWIRET